MRRASCKLSRQLSSLKKIIQYLFVKDFLVLVVIFIPVIIQSQPIQNCTPAKNISQNEGISDTSPQVFGDCVVWQGSVSEDSGGIFVYNKKTGELDILLYDTLPDYSPQIYGDCIVWYGNKNDEPGNCEIYLYDKADGTLDTLTDNDADDFGPQIHGNCVVWTGYDGDQEIYLYDKNAPQIGGTNISINDEDNDSDPQIYGNCVVWSGDEIYLYDKVSQDYDTLTAGGDNFNPQIYGNCIVWEHHNGMDREIILYDKMSEVYDTLSNNTKDDINPQIYGNCVVWQGEDEDGDYEIYLYDKISQQIDTLTDNESFIDDIDPQVFEDCIVWTSCNPTVCDIKLYIKSTKEVITLNDNALVASNPQVWGDCVIWNGDDITSGDEEIYLFDKSTCCDVLPPNCQDVTVSLNKDGEAVIQLGELITNCCNKAPYQVHTENQYGGILQSYSDQWCNESITLDGCSHLNKSLKVVLKNTLGSCWSEVTFHHPDGPTLVIYPGCLSSLPYLAVGSYHLDKLNRY